MIEISNQKLNSLTSSRIVLQIKKPVKTSFRSEEERAQSQKEKEKTG